MTHKQWVEISSFQSRQLVGVAIATALTVTHQNVTRQQQKKQTPVTERRNFDTLSLRSVCRLLHAAHALDIQGTVHQYRPPELTGDPRINSE